MVNADKFFNNKKAEAKKEKKKSDKKWTIGKRLKITLFKCENKRLLVGN